MLAIGVVINRLVPINGLSPEEQKALRKPAWGALVSVMYFPAVRLWWQAIIAWTLFLAVIGFKWAADTTQSGPLVITFSTYAQYAGLILIVISLLGVVFGRRWAWNTNQVLPIAAHQEREHHLGRIALVIILIGLVFMVIAIAPLIGSW